MIEMLKFPFMVDALKACLLLALILAYLGTHVIRRRIVFVDLALAQISSCGVAAAILFETNPTALSLIFTLLGASIFSIRIRDERIPQEAVMGIVYAVASSVAILFVAKAPHGEADILKILFGNILAVTGEEIIQMLVCFGIVALLHVIFFRRFALVTYEPEKAVSLKVSLHLWDFLFYISLGFVIAFAIRVGGVLLVFSYLIVPPVSAIILSRNKHAILIISLALGVLASFLGLYASYRFDLPTGAAIVSTLGCIIIASSLARYVISRFQ